MDGLQRAVALLDSHRGRDKVIRTLQYTTALCANSLPAAYGDIANPSSLAGKLVSFSRALGETRTILRLFDDLPTWIRLLRGNKVCNVY